MIMSTVNAVIIMLAVTFFIGLILTKPVIVFLKGLRASQTEREELESHKKKEGTPTMGGFIFIIAILVTFLVFLPYTKDCLPILLFSLGYGVIGFLDDFLKVVLRRSDGLIAWQKFILQAILCAGFFIYLYGYSGIDMHLRIPFTDFAPDLGYFGIPIVFIAILGTVNGVNFTDGLDGLASNVTLVVSVFLAVAAVLINPSLVYMPVLLVGGLLAFLTVNTYPAKTFMGDTGSLFLGGFVAGMSVMLGLTIYIVFFGFIYLVEVLSVIIQVLYFKKTGGKRIFRMAPIHHHFELGGWSETKTVYIFSLVTILMSLFSFAGLIN